MIAERIFHWADQTPDRTAIAYNGRSWSYHAFARLIAIARGYFARRSWTGPGVAALAVFDTLDFWVVSLALRSLGLTTMAIDWGGPDAQPDLPDLRCVVTSAAEAWPGLDAACASAGMPLIAVDLTGEAPLDLGAGGAADGWGGQILQTSGTTGQFKRVLIAPSFETEFLARRRRINGIDQGSVVNIFEFHPRTGVGYKSPASTWIAGGTVVCQRGGDMLHTLAHPGLTHATVVPSLLASILDAPPEAIAPNPALRLSVTGGTVTQAQIDAAKARITPHLYNGLGATESHIIALTPLDTPDDHRWHVPAPGSLVEIVDEHDRPAAIGQVGRLRVGAEGGPCGYLHDEAATRAFFRHGFFYSGDLAVRRKDGRIALQGRVTEVINVLGHKLSPGPIEDRLRAALGVSGVCLVSLQDAAGDEEIHVLIETPTPISTGPLAAALRSELAGVPHARVRYVTALPRNEMGKVLRQAAQAMARGA